MNLFALSGLLIGVLCTILSILVSIRGKRLFHYIWSFFCFSVAVWGFGSFKIATTLDPEKAILWWQIAHIGVILIPIFLTHFVYRFLDSPKKWLLRIIYPVGLLFLITNFINELFISKVRFVFNQFYYISSPPILYTFFVIFFLALVIYSHIKLWQAYKNVRGITKVQIKYILFATIPGFSTGALEFLPVYRIDLYPYLHFVIALSPVIVAYAILRYRLMDVQVALGRSAVYIFSFTTITALVLGLIFLNNKLVSPFSFYLVGSAIVLFSILFIRLVFRFYEKIASRYFYYTFYSSQKMLTNLTEKLNEVLELSKLTSLISDTLVDTMKLDRAGILLRDSENGQYKIQKIIGFREENGISLVKDNFLTFYLEKIKKPLVYEELELAIRNIKSNNEKEKIKNLQENMKRIEAKICLPLFRERKITGMIVLGSKISGDSYSEQDIDLLINFSTQASIALENARLYAQIQDLSLTLQQKVDEQTKEIRGQKEKVEKAYEVEKQAHEELKRVDEAKTNFMLITQHHLRTPLTVTMGFLDLLLNGTYGKIPKKIIGVVKKADEAIIKEIGVVNDLLSVSTFQLGKGFVNLDPVVSTQKILEEIVNDLKPAADNKKIYLKLENADNIPKISADTNQLKMALQNIIDNAIKYTKQGGVTVAIATNPKSQITNPKQIPLNSTELQRAKSSGSNSNFQNSKPVILITVKDTGIGMTSDDQKDLFEKAFQRSKEAWSQNATGKGIGLFLSAQIIKAHGGKIWAESEGRGKGSAFHIELPVIINIKNN